MDDNIRKIQQLDGYWMGKLDRKSLQPEKPLEPPSGENAARQLLSRMRVVNESYWRQEFMRNQKRIFQGEAAKVGQTNTVF